MDSQSSVTYWIGRLKAGDRAAVQQLWERYFDRLVRLARNRLGSGPRRMADEEAVALSAFHSFCVRVEQGKFPRLDDRTDLLRLLVVITSRKAVKQRAAAVCRKRGGGRVWGESAFLTPDADEEEAGIQAIAAQEPTPELAAEFKEEFERLLNCLDDDSLRDLALLKLQGFSNEEIAGRLDCSLRTVERRLRGIRAIWENES